MPCDVVEMEKWMWEMARVDHSVLPAQKPAAQEVGAISERALPSLLE